MRRDTLFLVVASEILLLGFSGLDIIGAASAQQLRRIPITGTIVDAADREVVGDAVVYLLQHTEQGLEGRHAESDSNGFFQLADVADAPMEFRVQAAGYTVARIEIDPRPVLRNLRRQNGGQLTDALSGGTAVVQASTDSSPNQGGVTRPLGQTLHIQIHVHRLATIMGRVLDSDGRGLPHATVAVITPSPEPEWLLTEVSRHPTETTQPNGSFTVDVPASRSFELEVTAEGCNTWRSDAMQLVAGRTMSVEDVVMSCDSTPAR